MPTTDAWRRLGELLVRRRIELDPRYSNRQVFTRERGINYRTVGDIERGARTNFDSTTIAAVEVAYGLAAGTVTATLAGGDLEPARSLAEPPSRPPLRIAEAPGRLPDNPDDATIERWILRWEPASRRQLLWDTWRFEAASREQRVKALRALTDPVDLEEEARERKREPGALAFPKRMHMQSHMQSHLRYHESATEWRKSTEQVNFS